jgi:hypothetical protein
MVDFEAIKQWERWDRACTIRGYLSWDETVDTAKLFTLPDRWSNAIRDIMQLPVAQYSAPRAVSGEIDTDCHVKSRTRKVMNTMSLENFFDGPPDDFDPNASNNPKPDKGKQLCILSKFYEKDTESKGRILAADLIIAQPAPGSQYQPGDRVTQAWFLSEPDKVKRRYQDARCRDFILALLGLPMGSPYGQHAKSLKAPHQPGTGILISITGEVQKDPRYLNYKMDHVPGQTAESIAANRNAVGAIEAQKQAQSTAIPMPANMQQAPHPSQMAQQYPAQMQYPVPQSPTHVQYTPSVPVNQMPMPIGPQAGYQQPQVPVQQPATAPVVGIPGFKFPGQ